MYLIARAVYVIHGPPLVFSILGASTAAPPCASTATRSRPPSPVSRCHGSRPWTRLHHLGSFADEAVAAAKQQGQYDDSRLARRLAVLYTAYAPPIRRSLGLSRCKNEVIWRLVITSIFVTSQKPLMCIGVAHTVLLNKECQMFM